MQILFQSPFSEMRAFWLLGNKEIEFHIVIPERYLIQSSSSNIIFNSSNILALISLSKKLMKLHSVEAIQTSLELQDASSLNSIKEGKDICISPFAIIK